MVAALRLVGDEAHALLMRSLKKASEAVEVRRAACLAMGRRAPEMTGEQRGEALKALLHVLKNRKDSLSSGFGLLALGRLVAAEYPHAGPDPRPAAQAVKVLLDDAENGSTFERGFAVLGLAFAAQSASAADASAPFVTAARKLMLEGLLRARGEDQQRAAYAVGAGLLRMDEAVDALCAVVKDRGADPLFRGHAAVALGQIGRSTEPVRECLVQLLDEERGVGLRLQAATALAILGRTLLQTKLVAELKTAGSEYHASHVVIALGNMGDLTALPDLLEYAADEARSDLPRALAVAALGMLTDPEARPSILRLTEDANYPAGTDTLYAAFTIF
jgi:HEAT repeat protein